MVVFIIVWSLYTGSLYSRFGCLIVGDGHHCNNWYGLEFKFSSCLMCTGITGIF